jgi:hypothetical protein
MVGVTQREVCDGCGVGYDVSYTNCPYCGELSSRLITLEPLVYDTECYAAYWLFSALNPRTNVTHVFEMCDGHPLDVVGLRNLLTTYEMISFNGIHYDMPMVTYALSGATTEQLKAANDNLIVGQMKHWEFYRAYNLQEPTSISHIDMIEVAPGQASLKAYGGKMHTRKLQDLPYDPNAAIDEAKRAVLRMYCGNDLQVTLELFNTFQEQLALRVEMGEEYGIDLRSRSDAQIAEAVMKSIVPFKVKVPSIPAGTQFNYVPPEWLHFHTPYLQGILARMTTEPFFVTASGSVVASHANHLVDWGSDQLRLDVHGQWSKKPAGWQHELVRIGDTSYAMGTGGLHSTESCVTWLASPSKSLRLPDVAAYYPSLIVRLGIYPQQLGPIFAMTYAGWKATRDAAKIAKQKKKANTYKTLNNGTFGKLGSRWSIFFTPAGLLQVTLTGQLALLMLIEALESAGITVVSANTDGIVIYADRDLDWFADSVIQWWESITGFTMETTEFKLLAARDINSYISITADNELKLKGAFAPPEPGASGWPNPTGQICVDAVVAYLSCTDQNPKKALRDTIRACTDIRQFVYVRTVKGGGSYCPVPVLPKTNTLTAMREALGATVTGNDPEVRAQYELLRQHRISKTEYLGKVVRWIYSRNSQGCILTPEGNLVPRTTGCRPAMELPDALPVDIDYDWYMREAESLLTDVGL